MGKYVVTAVIAIGAAALLIALNNRYRIPGLAPRPALGGPAEPVSAGQ